MGFSLLGKPGSPQRLRDAHDEFIGFVSVAFGFRPTALEASACTSPGETLAVVARHVRFIETTLPRAERADAMVRQALGRVLDRPLESFLREDRLDDLLPAKRRRELWRKLQIGNSPGLHQVRRPRSLVKAIFLATAMTFFGAIGLRGGRVLPWYLVPIPPLFVFVLMYVLTLPWANRCPLETVGLLIDRTAHEAVSFNGEAIGWTRAEAEAAIREFARNRYKLAGIDLSQPTPDTPLPTG